MIVFDGSLDDVQLVLGLIVHMFGRRTAELAHGGCIGFHLGAQLRGQSDETSGLFFHGLGRLVIGQLIGGCDLRWLELHVR